MTDTQRPAIELLIAAPRGFCAGVDRAIQIVELAIQKHGAPVYVRHEIVHNKFVVDLAAGEGRDLRRGTGPSARRRAGRVLRAWRAQVGARGGEDRGLDYLDATCPLVSKVHRQAERLVASGRHILFVGHAGHPEVIGTFGQVPAGQMTLIETVEDVAKLNPADPDNLAFLTQTTLSVDDTRAIVDATIARFPTIVAPKADDICYATSNRQNAVKAIAQSCDMVLVIGAPNSSNSVRLVEVAEREGTSAKLIQRATDLDFAWLAGVGTLGITAGASAPEILVRELVDRIATRFDVTEREVEMTRETIAFKLPRGLEAA
ncbi:4-hydroxy-3-methylbut-2-enyl diphosphate reductase [Sphingomonas hankookensis]|uniref:4-hydroxy-3-methylbut-2-enyl diphosphate reductase n=1 Tax=Sphingomonas hankookensis TaxID=563996 RepID=UPI003D301A79